VSVWAAREQPHTCTRALRPEGPSERGHRPTHACTPTHHCHPPPPGGPPSRRPSTAHLRSPLHPRPPSHATPRTQHVQVQYAGAHATPTEAPSFNPFALNTSPSSAHGHGHNGAPTPGSTKAGPPTFGAGFCRAEDAALLQVGCSLVAPIAGGGGGGGGCCCCCCCCAQLALSLLLPGLSLQAVGNLGGLPPLSSSILQELARVCAE